jgi:hypothetical protein
MPGTRGCSSSTSSNSTTSRTEPRAVLSRLAELAAASRVTVLVTDGLDTDLARRLAHDLGLDHQVVPRRRRPSWTQ